MERVPAADVCDGRLTKSGVARLPCLAPPRVEYLPNMPNESSGRIELLQGTLDMLILRTLLFGPAHGHQIAKHIQRTTEDVLQVEHGSLYPALHRLERKGWVAAKWEAANKELKREFKYYRLTPAGRKQLAAQESKWKQMAGAIARVMWPAEES
jgi:PadR family transcriptional regulator PadR